MVRQFFNNESGAGTAEYAILAGLIAIAAIATVALVGAALSEKFTGISAALCAAVNCTAG